MARRKKKLSLNYILATLVLMLITTSFYYIKETLSSKNVEPEIITTTTSTTTTTTSYVDITGEEIPDYDGNKVISMNGNIPNFSEDSYTTESFELYSALDSLGRCGVAYANIGIDLMPTEEREGIGSVKPSGWHTVKYDIVPGKYLYNRCHLIGYQLTGENANKENLITCTRSMNTETMLYYENKVTKYIKDTSNHVLYRVTPIYDGDSLVAKGIQMEAASVEDKCGAICYNIFIYNVQDGIEIDYKTGESKLKE